MSSLTWSSPCARPSAPSGMLSSSTSSSVSTKASLDSRNETGPARTTMCSAAASIWRSRSKKLTAEPIYSTPTPSSVGERDLQQLGELLERLDLRHLTFLEAVERGARDADAAGDLVGAEPGAEAEGAQALADLLKACGHARASRCRQGVSGALSIVPPGRTERVLDRRDDGGGGSGTVPALADPP